MAQFCLAGGFYPVEAIGQNELAAEFEYDYGRKIVAWRERHLPLAKIKHVLESVRHERQRHTPAILRVCTRRQLR